MSERPRVRGSVSRKGAGWLAQLPPSMGRRGKTHPTETAAWQWLQVEAAKHTLGLDGPADPGRILVRDLFDQWLPGHPLKESSRTDYLIRGEKHIKNSPIGWLPIGDVRPMDIDSTLTDIPANWTRVHVAGILSPFFNWAEANHFSVGNPYRQSNARQIRVNTTKTVQRKESTDNVWTPAQLVEFIENEPDPIYRDFWIFSAATGARRGEAIGVRWSNMHATEGWCWLADNITISGSKVIYNETPKNRKRRRAYFGLVVGKMLLARRDEQDAHKSGFDQWPATDWVFDRRSGKGADFFPGTHLAPSTVWSHFKGQTAKLGLPDLAGPHGLRRTFATIAEDENFKLSERTAALGHTPNVTGLYTKATVRGMQDLAERLANLILPNG